MPAASPPIPGAALAHHIGIVGKTGSGKSYAAQGIAEQLIAHGARVCIIDPTDRFWGLRLRPDGRGASGLEPVIFGGQHADLPLSGAHGAAIAEIAGTTTTPIILATRLMTVGERTRFFTDFAETLLRKNQGPLHLVIDEAHLFMPQAGAKVGGDAPKMLHAGNNLVSLGRGIGLRIMLLSQRPAKLHKDSLTQVETLVAFRLIAPQDRGAIREWVREWADEATGAEMMGSLPSLPTGTAWLWAPELDILRKVAFPRIETFDSGKILASQKAPALKPIDLAAVRGQLETIAREAVENDPKRLRAKIADLERALAKVSISSSSNEAAKMDMGARVAEAERRGYERGLEANREAFAAALNAIAEKMNPLVAKAETLIAAGTDLAEALRQFAPTVQEASPAPLARSGKIRQNLPESPAPVAQPIERRPSKPQVAGSNPAGRADGLDLTAPQRRILDALAWWAAIGVSPASRAQVAFVARYSPGSGAFANLLGGLRTAGYIDYPARNAVRLTDAGAAQAETPAAPPSTAELHARIFGMLREPQRRVLRPIIDAYPQGISRGMVAEIAGYSGGSGAYANLLGSLRTLQLIDYPAPGLVAARPALFVGGVDG